MKSDRLSSAIVGALLGSQNYATREAEKSTRQTRPFNISISREVGALGKSVAQELGKRLGWSVYDKELLEVIADQLKAPESALHSMDERVVSWVEEFAACLGDSKAISPYTYLKYLIATLRGMAEIGHCIVVGRGANFVLPRESTLSVRLVADLPHRVGVIRERMNLTETAARAYIEKTEPQRERFVRDSFGKDPNDPHHYDLILNTTRASVEDCADVIVALLQKKEALKPVPALQS